MVHYEQGRKGAPHLHLACRRTQGMIDVRIPANVFMTCCALELSGCLGIVLPGQGPFFGSRNPGSSADSTNPILAVRRVAFTMNRRLPAESRPLVTRASRAYRRALADRTRARYCPISRGSRQSPPAAVAVRTWHDRFALSTCVASAVTWPWLGSSLPGRRHATYRARQAWWSGMLGDGHSASP